MDFKYTICNSDKLSMWKLNNIGKMPMIFAVMAFKEIDYV